MMSTMLKVDNLSFSVNQKELIRKISLEIPQGSFVGLVGPNGSGKSTLLKTIYRANEATEGTVYIDDDWTLRPSQCIFQRDKISRLGRTDQSSGCGISVFDHGHYEKTKRYYSVYFRS